MSDTNEPRTSMLAQLWASVASTVILGVICCGLYPVVVWAVAQGVFPNQANGSLLKRDGSPTTDDKAAVGSALIGQGFALPGYFHPRPSAAGNSAGTAAAPTSFSPTGGYDPTSSGGSNYGPLSDELINGATLTPPAPTTQPATAAAAAPATAPATAPVETLAYDGVRLRTVHYAADNGLSFKLYSVKPDGTRTEVPLKQYQDATGTLNDVALVDAFGHPPTDAAGRAVLVAGDFKRADGTPVVIPADAVTASASGLDPHVSPDNAALQSQRVADARHVPVEGVRALVEQYTDKPGLGILGDPGVNVLRLNLALDAKYPLPAPPAKQPAAK